MRTPDARGIERVRRALAAVRIPPSRAGSLAAVFLFAVSFPDVAVAQDDPGAEPAGGSQIAFVQGPGVMPLRDLAHIAISGSQSFADGPTTAALLESWGNPSHLLVLGMVFPTAEDEDWSLYFEFDDVGYVTDEDQADIDADALLESYIAGTEAANETRREYGLEALHVRRWYQAPAYDPVTNDLTWALLAETDSGEEIINYDVRLLGRGGYTSVTLVTDPISMDETLPKMAAILDSFEYTPGNTYAEYRQGDKLAGYGLAALVGAGAAVAATKVGLFSALLLAVKKAGKLLLVGLVALAAAAKRLIAALTGRRKPAEPTA